jgi:hypothetical protein
VKRAYLDAVSNGRGNAETHGVLADGGLTRGVAVHTPW